MLGFNFFSRKQGDNESTGHSGKLVKGLPAKCESGTRSQFTVYDIIVLNMTLQKRFCIGHKETAEVALKYAVAIEQRMKQEIP